MTNTVELNKKFSDLEARFLAYEKTLPGDDPRKNKAQGLSRRIQGWQRDLDCLYMVWDRWSTDRKLLLENGDAANLPDARMRERRQQQLELQRDVDVPSLYFFAESFLNHIAESVGYLFSDEDLRDHGSLCRREILPRPMQERAVDLEEQIGLYWKRRAREYAQAGYEGAEANEADLTDFLQSMQTYAFGMAAFLDAALRHPALRLKKVGLFESREGRPVMLWVASLAGIVLLGLVGMSWTCLPDSLRDVLDLVDTYPPPLPAGCQLTMDGPSEATLQTLENRREARGLTFQSRVTCRMPKRSAGSAALDNFYIDKTLQQGRQVFLAETQETPGVGTLVVVESTLVPRWRYFKRLAGHCDAEL